MTANTEAAIAALRAGGPRRRLLAVAERLDEDSSFSLLRWGVKGLLAFSDTIDQLPSAVEEVARGGFWVPRPILSRFVETTLASAPQPLMAPAGRRLSAREEQVRDLLLENLSNREIADRLHMSQRTVKFHVSNLLAKFGVKRRADLIVLSYTSGRREEGEN